MPRYIHDKSIMTYLTSLHVYDLPTTHSMLNGLSRHVITLRNRSRQFATALRRFYEWESTAVPVLNKARCHVSSSAPLKLLIRLTPVVSPTTPRNQSNRNPGPIRNFRRPDKSRG